MKNIKFKFLIRRWAWAVLLCSGFLNLLSWYFITFVRNQLRLIEPVIRSDSMKTIEFANSSVQYIEGTLFGLIFGTFFILTDYLVEKSDIRKVSFGRLILFKSISYSFGLLLTVSLVYLILYRSGLLELPVTFQEMKVFFTFEFIAVTFIFILLLIFFLNFFFEVDHKFGPGNLWKMFSGKYHHPREEERIFMFLDLKGSTTLAEEMGHKLYSRMLKNCYYDLSEIVLKYEAEIYQYVGDEVVLSWEKKKGLKNLNCIKAYFEYDSLLRSKSSFYDSNFGVVPFFKAGLDTGIVTATEIGDIKREIAYHGDTLNTASRIQDLCNKYSSKMLISEKLNNVLGNLNGFVSREEGELLLRGKKENTRIFSVSLADQLS